MISICHWFFCNLEKPNENDLGAFFRGENSIILMIIWRCIEALNDTTKQQKLIQKSWDSPNSSNVPFGFLILLFKGKNLTYFCWNICVGFSMSTTFRRNWQRVRPCSHPGRANQSLRSPHATKSTRLDSKYAGIFWPTIAKQNGLD